MKYFKKFFVILTVLISTDFSKAEQVTKPKQKPWTNIDICQNQPNGALLPHTNDCHKFYFCAQQQPIEYNCNQDYHYDAATRQCMKGTSCSNNFNATASCIAGNIRSVKDDCNVFEACIKGEYQKLNCLPNYYFNAQKSICVPFKYDAEFSCNCLMPEYTVLENKNNCETYFVCHQKSAVLEYCPLGQYYNATLNSCMIDLEGVCLMKPTVHTNQIEEDIRKECNNLGLKNINFQTFPKGCNTFYICINGQIFTQHCPKDFYYEHVKKYCINDVTKKCLATENF